MKFLERRRKIKYARALLVGIGVVLFWRGLWGLFDKFLIPNNEVGSYIISAVLGLLVLAYTHSWIRELE